MRKFSRQWWAINRSYKKKNKRNNKKIVNRADELVTVSGYNGNLHLIDGQPFRDGYSYGYDHGDVMKRSDAEKILKMELGDDWKKEASIEKYKK